MVARAPAPNPRLEPLFDVHPQTGASIEVFYADRALETFGKGGVGWFWQSRQRGFSPNGAPTGPFATSYAAYRHAMDTAAPISRDAGGTFRDAVGARHGGRPAPFEVVRHERLANRISLSMCQAWDMDEPA